jgi:hypothetical protein
MGTYYRIDLKDKDPDRLLDPENQRSDPWSGTVKGRCDKCGGTGVVQLEGEQSDDRGFDADEGAVLVNPTRIVEVGALDWERVVRLEREIEA